MTVSPQVKTYRTILRQLLPTKRTARSQTALKHIRSAYAQARSLSAEQQEKQQAIAEVYASYLVDLKEYSDLIQEYNIGKTEKTTRDILESTAAATGLRLTEGI